jgi:hypothetical protein
VKPWLRTTWTAADTSESPVVEGATLTGVATGAVVVCVVVLDVTCVLVFGASVAPDGASVAVVDRAASFDGWVELQPHAINAATATQLTRFVFMVDSFTSSAVWFLVAFS